MPRKLADAIRTVNSKHRYVADRGEDWDINPVGDCEDYALAVIWEYSGGWLSFARNILSGAFRLHFVRMANGGGHVVAEHDGMFFDNNYRALVPRATMEANGFRFVRTYWRLRVLLKIAF